MFREYARLAAMGVKGYIGGTPDKLRMWPERLVIPLRWRRPRRIFVNSMSDLFHESVTDHFITEVFQVMRSTPHHIFQVLTKRPERMLGFLARVKRWEGLYTLDGEEPRGYRGHAAIVGDDGNWPLPNIWLGVSVEDQATADERIPLLLQTTAAVRWVSYEPALGPVDLTKLQFGWIWDGSERKPSRHNLLVPITIFGDEGDYYFPGLDWVVCGGESGPNARPSHPDWFRNVRDQCQAAGVPFFLKKITEKGRKIPFERFPDDLKIREYPVGGCRELVS
jgi:protein gp37